MIGKKEARKTIFLLLVLLVLVAVDYKPIALSTAGEKETTREEKMEKGENISVAILKGQLSSLVEEVDRIQIAIKKMDVPPLKKEELAEIGKELVAYRTAVKSMQTTIENMDFKNHDLDSQIKRITQLSSAMEETLFIIRKNIEKETGKIIL